MIPDFQGYDKVVEIERGRISSLFKGRVSHSQHPVLLRQIPLKHFDKSLRDRLNQEVERLRTVSSDFVLKVYDHTIVSSNGDASLLLAHEDFTGIPLMTMIPEFPRHLARAGEKNARFCFYAIQMAGALKDIHKAGLLHQGLNPHGFLFNSASRHLKLNGFAWEHAWRPACRRIMNSHAPVDVLACIAPEQTGRINHSEDFRANLYSLGVIFYEMLCGFSPFPKEDSVNIIYSHMAGEPAPPARIDATIHPAVSSLVMKLLAKQPKDRYQSVSGLLRDLQELEIKLDSGVDLSSFVAGRHDVRPVFKIPATLRGREKELDFLKKCYDRVSAGDSSVVMVTGAPGVGKTTLLREIGDYVRNRGGIFLTGKFDRQQQNVPLSASKAAVTSLARWLLTRDSQELAGWRQKILAAVSPNGRILTELIPELELIIGQQPPVCELPPWEANLRFALVLEKFASLFLRPEHPVVFCLDDMQWSDKETLEHGLAFLLSKQRQYCMSLGTYRDNEVDQDHPLTDYLEKIQRTSLPLEQLRLTPFDKDQTAGMVAGILEQDTGEARALSEIVHYKTGGNPFFIVQFMNSLHSSGLIHYDFDEGCWKYNWEQVAGSDITDNMAKLLTDKISTLPRETLKILWAAACCGNRLDIGLLSAVCDSDPARIENHLAEAVKIGLLRGDEESRSTEERPGDEATAGPGKAGLRHGETGPVVEFAHDQIMQAIYQAIPADQARRLHRRIGRAMVRRAPPDLLHTDIFDIMHQFERCVELFTSDAEKIELARLYLLAGEKAMEAVTFEAAAGYLRSAAGLLPEDCWQEEYKLTNATYNRLAKCEFVLGNPAASERLFEVLLRQATSLMDQANAYNAMVSLNSASGRVDKAIQLGRQGLKLFGLTLPDNPGKTRLLYLLIKLRLLWGFRRVSTIVDAPQNNDEHLNLTLTLLANIGVSAFYTNPRLCLWINLTGSLLGIRDIRRGLPLEHASFGLITLGAFLGSMFGFLGMGRTYARIGMNLLKKYPNSSYRSIACFMSALFNRHWHEPARNNVAYFKRAYRLAFKMGDIMNAGHSINAMFSTRLFLGDDLEDIHAYHQRHEKFIRNSRLPFAISAHTVLTRFYLSLKGQTVTPAGLNGDGYDLEREYQRAEQRGNGLLQFIMLLLCLKLEVFFRKWDEALATSRKLGRLAHIPAGTLMLTEYYFFASLAATALLHRGTTRERAGQCRRIAYSARKKMKRWSRLRPDNFGHLLTLMKAEKEKIAGRPGKALRHYRRAVELAEDGGYNHVVALACECAGRFLISQNDQVAAGAYLEAAEKYYTVWGASAKAADMKKRYPGFLTAPAEKASVSPLEQFDNKVVVEALQAISREIEVRKLLTRFMGIIRENSGANRVVFLANRNDELFVEVESRGEETGETSLKSEPLLNRTEATLSSVVHYVKRTHQLIMFNNLKNAPDFIQFDQNTADPPQSLLCLPMMRQKRLVGILYLENTMTTGLFTKPRLEILKMFASQAAISFENATLYEQVIKSERDLESQSRKLRGLYSELMLTGERERRRIATDLHDRIGHALATAKMQLEKFREDPGAVSGDRLDDLLGLVEQSIADTRTLTFELSPPILYHLGLGAALDWLCEETRQKHGLAVSFRDFSETEAADDPIDQKTSILCFQALRELMFNAVKYARADEIRVTLDRAAGDVILTITDDGVGFDLDKQGLDDKNRNGGFGLFSINERLRLVNGRLTIQSAPGQGTRISLSVPEGSTITGG